MNIESALQTNIPDIASVYGGVRGRTISSNQQAYAWKGLIEAGLRQVIDLRQDYKGSRYQDACESRGIAYFHYPVHRGREYVEKMVRQFSMFCSLIDQGDFFISCAQGLHRTDIALCTYWVFHGADAGKEPPQLHGYLQEKGHTAGKIFYVLNTFFDCYTECYKEPPISSDVFRERKLIIEELCRNMINLTN